MKIQNPWPAFRARILLLLIPLFLVAWLSGYPLAVFLAAAIGWIAWDLLNLRRLERWLRLTRKLDPPQSIGLWGEIFDGLYRMRRRSRNRDKDRRKLMRNYRDSIRAMPDGMVVLQGDYRIEWCNSEARDLLGLKWPRDQGQRITKLFRHPEFIAMIDGKQPLSPARPSDYSLERSKAAKNRSFAEAADDHDPDSQSSQAPLSEPEEPDESPAWSASVRAPTVAGALRPGGARILALHSPVNGKLFIELRLIPFGRKQHLLLARDVTALRRLETMRSDFVANVSHELRTPLTVIYGIAETFAEDFHDHPEWNRSAALLLEQSGRMKRLVEDLLLLSRLERTPAVLHADWVPIVPLLTLLVEEARHLSGERAHRIELEAEPDWLLFGNESELRSAFANLLFNAIHYSPPGSRIWVRWTVDPWLGGYFQVRDEGPGIAPEHIDRLTERFYRVDKGRSQSQGGTGLGLAIVKHVLLRHGGELLIESVVGKGSQFTALFPMDTLRQPKPSLSFSMPDEPRSMEALSPGE